MPDIFRQGTQVFATTLNSHRIALYALVSVIAVFATIANALKSHSNFYSVAIYLSKSNRSLVVLLNFLFLLTVLDWHITQRIVFGPLRAAEVERLYDRLWFFVTESLLAFTIFRDDFDIPFAVMFTSLLYVKTFHWLAADRVEWMDQRPYPGPPLLFHFRMSGLFISLWIVDCFVFLFAAGHTLTNGVGGMVLFASEYAILMGSALNITAKYLLSVYELRRASQRGGENAPPWENKSIWVFYIELTTDFLKLTTYLIFFTIIILYYGLPLNIIRDVYMTARSFITRLRALRRYQTATRNMDQLYPNATPEEMAAMTDRTCIICREEMILRGVSENGVEAQAQPQPQPQPQPQAPVPAIDGPNTTPKKLPCGHIFHFHCLRSWLERQQSCPTCRRTVLEIDRPARPAPQPGAVPQPPNVFGIPQQNPLGILGGMLGIADRPPIVPGQFAQGQMPPGQLAQFPAAANAPPNQRNVPVNAVPNQPGVLVHYTIQYNVPRPTQQQLLQAQTQQNPGLQNPRPLQHPQPAQPVPHFQGFQGPGGAHLPWGMGHAWFEQDHENPQQPATPSIPGSAPTATTPSRPRTQSSPQEDTPAHNISSPEREAAAGTSIEPGSASELPADSSGSTRTTSLADVETASSTPPSSPTSSRESVAPSQSVVNDDPFEVPPLIPWSNYAAARPVPPQPASTQYARTPPGPVYGVWPQQPPVLAQTPPAPHPRFHPPHAQPQPSTSRPPLSQLPPTLTDEQLAMMDTLTREAIDERLRVLDGVSGAVYRCIDDLMRIRSILPAKSPGTAAPPPIIPVHSNGSAQAPVEVSSGQSPESSSEGSKAKDSDEKSTLDAASTSQTPSNDISVPSQSSST